MTSLKFGDWFVAQHGARSPHAAADTDDVLRQKIHMGEMAARELKRRQEWDARHESALYAWTARDVEMQQLGKLEKQP